ncbi:thermonuclease family protein [Notoacmeibacter ruber]|uniref:thermonuclease family protein n=1 Tax=Notoacmeibacter ruber TaxID=2670375 RepID=UPI001AEC9C04|nr:thermonuclease family protein [Notoacmeibacter ruber]
MIRRIAPGRITPELDVSTYERGAPREPLSSLAGPNVPSITIDRESTFDMAEDDWSWKRLFRPTVTAANRLEAQGYTLSLSEIVAPEIGERCTDGVSRCGVIARASLRRWLRGRAITCLVPPTEDSLVESAADTGILRTRCLLGGEDIATWLVASGWALPVSADTEDGDEADLDRADDLVALNEEARRDSLGLYGLGGWSPGEICGTEDTQPCAPEIVRDPAQNLSAPKWTYPVITILPTAEWPVIDSEGRVETGSQPVTMGTTSSQGAGENPYPF